MIQPASRTRRLFKEIFILPLLLLTGMLSAAAQETYQLLKPYYTAVPPVLDGVLNDPVWENAPQETGFKTYTPDYEIAMSEQTIVYYAYDRENLYFAFRCFDSEPHLVKTSVNSRDNIRPDDWICINLDTFNDHQSLYALYVNPLGIQGDSRFEGGVEDFSVDVVWYSTGRVDEEGYAVELKIPFKSIRFSHKDPVTMGVIFERFISRRTEAATYPPLSPDIGPNFLTQTRPLLFHDIKHYTLFEILPAVTYSRNRTREGGKLNSPKGVGDISLTAKYGITSHLIFDGTYNPDFSQVESDAGQVDFNLRYSLFFPEKRPFFLEGLEKFHFGGAQGGDPLGAVVHTRNIVDPLTGFKLNGRLGEKNSLALIYAMDELPETAAEQFAHFGIIRYKRSLKQDGFIGGFYTGRERASGYNRVVGADGQIRLSPSGMLGFHLFQSATHGNSDGPARGGHAFCLDYLSSTRDWILMAGIQDISDDFQTETGYLTRTGLTRVRTGVLRMFYPQSKVLQRIEPMVHSFHLVDRNSELYETFNSFDIRFILLRNTFFLAGGAYSNEIWLGKRFSTSRFRFTAASQITKKVNLNLSYYYKDKIRYIDDPYQGRGSDASFTIAFLPSEKLHLDASLVYSDFFRSIESVKEYDYLIFRSRNTYQVNKYLFFRAIAEYNSFRKEWMTDLLASFTYIPGTVIHIGYGSLYERYDVIEGEYRPVDRFLETKRGFFFKASFLWRL